MSNPPICPACNTAHSGAVTCEGKPIDWEKRRERARAFIAQPKWTTKRYEVKE